MREHKDWGPVPSVVAASRNLEQADWKAVAYNAGTLNRTRQAGVGVVEVFDGFDCGWTSHQDADKANRHPWCRRGFGPRPNVDAL
ncbi:hypothetical protein OG285_06050 [Streptomyces sp. NBC_01471]|uniref:hypothetical protein n=1 Tax=Streptomyces sp. NBC_01471 TaxID=2903879 RepID=UPI00324DB618